MIKRAAPSAPPAVVVCATMRSGSTMICEDMRNTGSLGSAQELFLDWKPADAEPWAELVETLLADNRTANGVFSVKVMSRYLPDVEACLAAAGLPAGPGPVFPRFAKLFDGAAWVYLKRNDVVAQAVSRFVARETGVFHHFDDHRHKRRNAAALKDGLAAYSAAVPYDFKALNTICNKIRREEIVWEHFFRENNVAPLRLTYEDCIDDFGPYLHAIAGAVGVDLEAVPAQRTITRLATAHSDELHRRFSQDIVAAMSASPSP